MVPAVADGSPCLMNHCLFLDSGGFRDGTRRGVFIDRLLTILEEAGEESQTHLHHGRVVSVCQGKLLRLEAYPGRTLEDLHREPLKPSEGMADHSGQGEARASGEILVGKGLPTQSSTLPKGNLRSRKWSLPPLSTLISVTSVTPDI